MEDQQIIQLYWDRREQAIWESDRKYGAYCRSIARRILAVEEDAEECVNDTWLHAWNAMPPQRPSILSAFFGKLARNLSLDRWRRNRAAKRGGDQVELALHELGDCLPAPAGRSRLWTRRRRAGSSPSFSAPSRSWTGPCLSAATGTWSPLPPWPRASTCGRARSNPGCSAPVSG